ncbi:type VII secretion protein EccE [Amycolatopsis cynarae]|uniref:Type VII secretion protein EccE n=1 Tax=Amycolatopsis cynarae TaxID=2995223 RepID=A0ABY7B533_9PSEU|nr:type VII secretion protein EccE [Amycolatopsis sp. HUAS 11-8]WAL67296.1 type VII secretion protein EccE [Amycolatopsis sp. HUAS 11-8]
MTTADARLPGIAGGGPGRRDGRPRPAGRTWLRPVRFGQFAAWEVAAFTVPLACRAYGPGAVLPAALLALLVVAATSVRIAGRHLAGWALTWIAYRLQAHDDRRRTTDPLLVLAPDLRLRQHSDRAGNRFGIAGIGDGWTAVVKLSGEPDLPTVVAIARRACEDLEIPLGSAQVLVRSRAGRRTYLLAVRYLPGYAPLAAFARGHGELGELRATARAALGVLGALYDAGYGGTVLEAGELAAELRETLGAPLTAEVIDGWRSWTAGTVSQACFTPLPGAFPEPVADPPGALGTTVSYTVRRTRGDRLRDEVTIRVAWPAGTRRPQLREPSLPAVPLYGRHEAAVRATLPFALPR